ncbi:MAG TPA: hypothetical protein PKI93_06375, partial [Alphaproteobacteria bacterium]|nr:hypothetical protein [Alphaproteobacteria bacterium]
DVAMSGHSDIYMSDPQTHLMTGKMNDQTKYAASNTVNGKPTLTAYMDAGIPAQTVYAMTQPTVAPSTLFAQNALDTTAMAASLEAPKRGVTFETLSMKM